MTALALITGASSGLGREFARIHASNGGDVIITARREAELLELKSELESKHGITAHVIPLDLGAEGGAQTLRGKVKDAGLSPGILINNAGFGGHGRITERALEADLAMIDLNVKALVSLTHLYAADMAERGGGKILNIGSTAGYMPGPLQATYFATKAFVNSFSMAVDEEMRGKGVTCTTLAPGLVDTEFVETADLGGTGLSRNPAMTAADSARVGYDAMMAGDLIKIDRFSLAFLLNAVVPFVPKRMMLRHMAKSQEK